jgi:hypothetical protein
VQGKDVRVLQSSRDFDLPHEPVGTKGGRQLGSQNLEGYTSVVLQVFGQVDRGHPALANFPFDPVAIG